MEGSRGPEFAHEKSDEPTDEGFSEKRAARIIEGTKQDNSQVKKRKPVVAKQRSIQRAARNIVQREKSQKRASRNEVSLKEKIKKAYEKNAQEIQKLMHNFTILSQDSFAVSEQLMTHMRARQHLQEELLNALALESQGELTEDTLSKELIDLIK